MSESSWRKTALQTVLPQTPRDTQKIASRHVPHDCSWTRKTVMLVAVEIPPDTTPSTRIWMTFSRFGATHSTTSVGLQQQNRCSLHQRQHPAQHTSNRGVCCSSVTNCSVLCTRACSQHVTPALAVHAAARQQHCFATMPVIEYIRWQQRILRTNACQRVPLPTQSSDT